jgi:hypothetical protein
MTYPILSPDFLAKEIREGIRLMLCEAITLFLDIKKPLAVGGKRS